MTHNSGRCWIFPSRCKYNKGKSTSEHTCAIIEINIFRKYEVSKNNGMMLQELKNSTYLNTCSNRCDYGPWDNSLSLHQVYFNVRYKWKVCVTNKRDSVGKKNKKKKVSDRSPHTKENADFEWQSSLKWTLMVVYRDKRVKKKGRRRN